MSGTDHRLTPEGAAEPAPVVILVAPQLGENVGMVARAMLNTGLAELRLVAPRDGWPNETAWSAASGADAVLAEARLYDTTAEAVRSHGIPVQVVASKPDGLVLLHEVALALEERAQ